MSNEKARNHPNAPHNQKFNVRGNHTTKRGWWKRGSNKV